MDDFIFKARDGQPYTLRSEYSEPFGWDENESHFRSAFMGNHFFAESSSYKMDPVKGLVNGYKMIAYYMTANGDLLQREMSVSSGSLLQIVSLVFSGPFLKYQENCFLKSTAECSDVSILIQSSSFFDSGAFQIFMFVISVTVIFFAIMDNFYKRKMASEIDRYNQLISEKSNFKI